MVHQEQFTLKTKGHRHMQDVTGQVAHAVKQSGIRTGVAQVFAVGSTAAMGTVEFEPGLLEDIPEFLEKLLPSDRPYRHDDTWHDGNGFSHMRSFLLKTSHTVPFSEGRLMLGTWQQIVLADFDNRRRERKVVVQLVGE